MHVFIAFFHARRPLFESHNVINMLGQLSGAVFYSIDFWTMYFQAPTIIVATGKKKKNDIRRSIYI